METAWYFSNSEKDELIKEINKDLTKPMKSLSPLLQWKKKTLALLMTGSIVMIPSASGADLPTNGNITSRISGLSIKSGYPTSATAQKLYDEMDFQRTCQAYLDRSFVLPDITLLK